MNFLLFDHSTYNQLYNCSFLPQSEWDKQKDPSLIGILYIGLATMFQALYIPFLIVMKRQHFFKYSCYKLMFLIGLVDVLATFVGGTMAGIFLINGDYFCTGREFLFFVSCFNETVWVTACITGIWLLINRILDLLNKEIADFFFNGARTYIWYMFSFIYGGYFLIFFKPYLINAKMYATFANPYAGMVDIPVDGSIYLDPFGPYHDYAISAMFPVLYFILCVILVIKTRGGTQAITKLQKQLIVQSIILSAFTIAACYLFLYMQFFYVPQYFSILSHVIWQSSHGASVFTYIINNKSMRTEVIGMLKQIKGEKAVIINPINPKSIHVKPTWLRTNKLFG